MSTPYKDGRKAPEFHGMSKTPEYRAWVDIKRRCLNPDYREKQYYIARGITVCEAWANSFLAFYTHVGKRPSPQHSIDRIDNDGNYEPGNVRWASKMQQVLNRRMQANNTSGHIGIYKVRNKRSISWVADIKRGNVTKRLGYFKSIEQAVKAREESLV